MGPEPGRRATDRPFFKRLKNRSNPSGDHGHLDHFGGLVRRTAGLLDDDDGENIAGFHPETPISGLGR